MEGGVDAGFPLPFSWMSSRVGVCLEAMGDGFPTGPPSNQLDDLNKDVLMLPYSKQTIEKDDLTAVTEALQSDWLTTGPRVEEFENELLFCQI